MKFAQADFIVWLIIALIVIVSKLWNKFVTTQEQEKHEPPQKRPARPPQRPRPPAERPPPIVRTEETWPGPPPEFREFMERLVRPPQPPEPVAPAPRAVTPPAPPPRPAPKPAPAAQPLAPQLSRASQWAEALRDRHNLRNIIVAAEIIGPPRSLQSSP